MCIAYTESGLNSFSFNFKASYCWFTVCTNLCTTRQAHLHIVVVSVFQVFIWLFVIPVLQHTESSLSFISPQSLSNSFCPLVDIHCFYILFIIVYRDTQYYTFLYWAAFVYFILNIQLASTTSTFQSISPWWPWSVLLWTHTICEYWAPTLIIS